MPDKETLFVVVSVDEPTRNSVCPVAPNLTTGGIEHIHPGHLDPDPRIGLGQQRDIRFAENHEQIPFSSVLELLRHMQIRIHSRLEDWNSPQSAELSRICFVVESTSN